MVRESEAAGGRINELTGILMTIAEYIRVELNAGVLIWILCFVVDCVSRFLILPTICFSVVTTNSSLDLLSKQPCNFHHIVSHQLDRNIYI